MPNFAPGISIIGQGWKVIHYTVHTAAARIYSLSALVPVLITHRAAISGAEIPPGHTHVAERSPRSNNTTVPGYLIKGVGDTHTLTL